MSKRMNPGIQGLLLVVSAYIATLLVAILIISLALSSLIDTSKCSALSRALPILWGGLAFEFLISLVVVGILARRIISSLPGRWVVIGGYGGALLVSYVGIALGLLIFFNC